MASSIYSCSALPPSNETCTMLSSVLRRPRRHDPTAPPPPRSSSCPGRPHRRVSSPTPSCPARPSPLSSDAMLAASPIYPIGAPLARLTDQTLLHPIQTSLDKTPAGGLPCVRRHPRKIVGDTALPVDELLYGHIEVAFTLVEGSVSDPLDEPQCRASDALRRVALEVLGK